MEILHYLIILLFTGSFAYKELWAYRLRSEGWTVIRIHPFFRFSIIIAAIIMTAPSFVSDVLSGIEPRLTAPTIAGLVYIVLIWPVMLFGGWLLFTFQTVRWRNDDLIFESVIPFSSAGHKNWDEISSVDRKNICLLHGVTFDMITTRKNQRILSLELDKRRQVSTKMILAGPNQ